MSDAVRLSLEDKLRITWWALLFTLVAALHIAAWGAARDGAILAGIDRMRHDMLRWQRVSLLAENDAASWRAADDLRQTIQRLPEPPPGGVLCWNAGTATWTVKDAESLVVEVLDAKGVPTHPELHRCEDLRCQTGIHVDWSKSRAGVPIH